MLVRVTFIGSGALSGKMLLVSIVENHKIDDYLDQVRLSKGQLFPAGLGKGLGQCPAGFRNRKNTPLYFNNPRSNIKPKSVPKKSLI